MQRRREPSSFGMPCEGGTVTEENNPVRAQGRRVAGLGSRHGVGGMG
ncbi:hypothetical protein GL267_013940 [Acidithiobacillus ferrianus]|uniref:Uncharacterized protein n=2 Tax=Acidithiobacillus ferrianus TaxID=2678518 RepID=A0A845U5K3_9PROT|nr:hypothetical protein [Acidithiobacillus ferrianus]NDU41469.1 hypothetical protein [Acidithiobacillus ferrianus]